MSTADNIEWSEDLLRSLYVEQGLTMQQIAAQLGCRIGMVHRRLMDFGIPRRPIGPVKEHRFGPILTDPEEFPRETDEQAAMWRELLARATGQGAQP